MDVISRGVSDRGSVGVSARPRLWRCGGGFARRDGGLGRWARLRPDGSGERPHRRRESLLGTGLRDAVPVRPELDRHDAGPPTRRAPTRSTGTPRTTWASRPWPVRRASSRAGLPHRQLRSLRGRRPRWGLHDAVRPPEQDRRHRRARSSTRVTCSGTSAASGNVTGPHLHFEERKDGAYFPPYLHRAAFTFGRTRTSANCTDRPIDRRLGRQREGRPRRLPATHDQRRGLPVQDRHTRPWPALGPRPGPCPFGRRLGTEPVSSGSEAALGLRHVRRPIG